MFLVYERTENGIMPTGDIKSLKEFNVGEIFIAPEYAESGLEFVPYKVIAKNNIEGAIRLQSIRLEV